MTSISSRLAAACHRVFTDTLSVCKALALVALVFCVASPSFASGSYRTPPTIAGVAPTTAAVGQTYSFQPVVQSRSQVSFSIQNRPSWAAFNTATGKLSGTPQGTDVGAFASITIQVQNRFGSASLQSFTIVVTGTSPISAATAPPTIGGVPASMVQALAAYSFTPVASSPRGAVLSFSVQNLPSWATFSTVTGQITGSPSAANVGVFSNVIISVNDGTATASLAPFTIDVTAAALPTITGVPATSVNASATYTFTPAASSPRGAILSFSVQNLPSWATFDSTTGQLWGTPSAASIGTFANITIAVYDGTGTATLAPFTIKVMSVPPPTISGAPATTAVVGKVYAFTPTTTNPSGGTMSFIIANQPVWASFNATTGQLSGTPAASDVGTAANIIITVSDGTSKASLAPFSISVTAPLSAQAAASNNCSSKMSTGQNASLGGYRMFSATSSWNQDVSAAPVDPNSATYIAAIGSSQVLRGSFGTQYGLPYVVADSNTQARVPVHLGTYAAESDAGPFAIPASAIIGGGPDEHLLVMDRATCWLYELYNATANADGSFSAANAAAWDMTGDTVRPNGWTSADAAGLPILPGLVRYDEVASGAISHALRFTLTKTRQAYVAPATHWASSSTDPTLLPMGARLRLKASIDISKFSAANQVILTALKKYGMFVADNGPQLEISGTLDSQWNDPDIWQLMNLTANDFEVVQLGNVVDASHRPPAGAAPVIASFYADNVTVASGATVTLSFAATGASTLVINPDVGPVRGNSVTVQPTVTTTYTLYADNAFGRTTSTVTVTVQ